MKLIHSFVVGCVAVACGPNLEPGHIKSPAERLRDEETAAYEREQEYKDQQGDDGPVEPDYDPFDRKQAEMELKRASRSARTCGDVVQKKNVEGIAEVTITFRGDGTTKDAHIGGELGEGAIGTCIQNAYKAVIVPPFSEDEFTMDWQLDLSGKNEVNAETEELEREVFGTKDGKELEKEEGKKKGKKKKKK